MAHGRSVSVGVGLIWGARQSHPYNTSAATEETEREGVGHVTARL